jgi:AcrR family transcriptional regulator
MSRQNPVDRKASILDAAVRMSRNYGYAKVTRADIAHAAQCSEALVSSYWGTMVQVRRAVIRWSIKNRDLVIVAQALVAKDAQAMKAPQELRKAAVATLVG